MMRTNSRNMTKIAEIWTNCPNFNSRRLLSPTFLSFLVCNSCLILTGAAMASSVVKIEAEPGATAEATENTSLGSTLETFPPPAPPPVETQAQECPEVKREPSPPAPPAPHVEIEVEVTNVDSEPPPSKECEAAAGPEPPPELSTPVPSVKFEIPTEADPEPPSVVENLHPDPELPRNSLITVSSGYKSYGKQSVLDNLCIEVRQGTIYALLGASGCGKTTLLSCIVGTKRLDSGSITCGGQDLERIRSCEGGLRSRVGYMPQELALYREFTIREALLYFGRIYDMDRWDILRRGKFLVDLLHLPKWSTEIRNMSGGQQRRTSFACALIHAPELLILDEPTVGVDPLLRKSIWEYLNKLVTTSSTTVIITTHYIDEARAADTVGLMRSGRILAEGAPDALMERHAVGSLEQLFLMLSEADETELKALELEGGRGKKKRHVQWKDGKNPKKSTGRGFPRIFPHPGYKSRLAALIMKNFVYIWRQILFIFFLLLFPAIQIFLCCWAIGTEPWGLPFGVVNQELGAAGAGNCVPGNMSHLSCEFLSILQAGDTFSLLPYESEGKALNGMKRQGETYGYFILSKDFSAHVESQALGARIRQRKPRDTEVARAGAPSQNETGFQSALTVQLDQTSRHISISIQKALGEAYQELLATVRKRETNAISLTAPAGDPIQYQTPIYGHTGPTIVIDYVGPGLVLGVIFFAAISITGLSYVVEKREGMLERSIVAGVSPSEIITAHLLSQCAIVVLQTGICLAVLFGVFRVPIHGPLHWVVVLAVLQGFLGMFAGFVLSSVCDEEKVVMQWSLAITLPMVVVAGIFWPTAGMPEVLQYVGQILVPQTWAAESIRSMLSRGWGLMHPKVWPGFAVTLGYSVGLWVLANIFAQRSVSPKAR